MQLATNNPTLVVLAAGVGRRFGGVKQLTPVGPGGETILDYTIFDAVRTGICRVVFVIRPEIEMPFRSFVVGRFGSRVSADLAFQRVDDLPDGFGMPPDRTKPWGTGHALLSAAERIGGPFVVANADDFYGAGAIATLATFLIEHHEEYGLVTYRMRDTLAPGAAVSRALCRVSATGDLEGIEELTSLHVMDRGAVNDPPGGEARSFTGDEPVSMNLWGFRPDVFGYLRAGFRAFLGLEDTARSAVARDSSAGVAGTASAGNPGDTRRDLLRDEYYLPECVNQLVASGGKRVRVIPAGESRWFGMTHPGDHARVTAEIRRLIQQGVYPERLWS
jgi:hypothetical protein